MRVGFALAWAKESKQARANWFGVNPRITTSISNGSVGRVTPFSVAYAVCYLESPVTQTNLVLRIGSDDQAKIFLNECEVYRSTRDSRAGSRSAIRSQESNRKPG